MLGEQVNEMFSNLEAQKETSELLCFRWFPTPINIQTCKDKEEFKGIE